MSKKNTRKKNKRNRVNDRLGFGRRRMEVENLETRAMLTTVTWAATDVATPEYADTGALAVTVAGGVVAVDTPVFFNVAAGTATGGGVDFTGAGFGSILIPAGDYSTTAGTFDLLEEGLYSFNDDDLIEVQESFAVQLTGGAGIPTLSGVPEFAFQRIDDNDFAKVTIGNVSTTEGSTGMVPVTLETFSTDADGIVDGEEPKLTTAISLEIITADGDGVESDDYEAIVDDPDADPIEMPFMVSFAVNDSNGQSVNVPVPTNQDTLIEGDEVVLLVAQNEVGVDLPENGSLTIADNDLATVQFSDSSEMVAEPGTDPEPNASVTLDITLSTPDDEMMYGTVSLEQDLTVTVEDPTVDGTADPEDFSSAPTFPVATTLSAGSSSDDSLSFSFDITDDDILEIDESLTLVPVITGAGTLGEMHPSYTLMIADDEAGVVSISIVEPDEGEEPADTEGDTFSLTVSIDAGDAILEEAVPVTYTIDDGVMDAVDADDLVGFTLTGTLMIPTSGTLTVDIESKQDFVIENDEVIDFTLDGVDSASNITIDTANDNLVFDVNNDDVAVLSVTGTMDGSEELEGDGGDPEMFAPTPGELTVSLGGVTSTEPTVLNVSLSGSATDGSDFTGIGATVTIPAGEPSITVPFDVLQDSVVESAEQVTLQVDSMASGHPNTLPSGYTSGDAIGSATITDDGDMAVVSVAVLDDTANEVGTDVGVFQISLDQIVNEDVVVDFTISGDATEGTDFTSIGGSATIVSGSTTANIIVIGLEDLTTELDETVTITLDDANADTDPAIPSLDSRINIDLFANSGDVTIQDGDGPPTYSIDIVESSVTEGGGFSVNVTTSALPPIGTDNTIELSLALSSEAGTLDSDFFDQFVTFSYLPNPTVDDLTQTIDFATTADTLLEGPEDLVLELSTGGSDTLTIVDGDSDMISVVPGNDAEEQGEVAGTFTIELDGGVVADEDITVEYTISGGATAPADLTDDFTTPVTATGTATIEDGSTSVVVTIGDVFDDLVVEGDETIALTITSFDAPESVTDGTLNAEIGLVDNDAVEANIVAGSNAVEGGVSGTFTIDIGEGPMALSDTTVNYAVGGTSTEGTDFPMLTGSVVIPVNETTATITIDALIDNVVEPDETVVITLLPSTGVTIGSNDVATIDIESGETSLVLLTGGSSDTTVEGGADAQILVFLTLPVETETELTFTLTGDAELDDYDVSSDMGYSMSNTYVMTIPGGSVSGSLDIDALPDDIVEGVENAVITLTSTNNTDVAPLIGADSRNITIVDQDELTVTIDEVTVTEGNDGTTTTMVEVSLDQDVEGGVSLMVDGSSMVAVAGTDYDAGFEGDTLTFVDDDMNGFIDDDELTLNFEFTVNGDLDVEPDEVVDLTATMISLTNGGTIATPVDGSVTIEDDDTASVGFTSSTESGSEGDIISLTLELEGVVQEGFTVDVSTMADTADASDFTLLDDDDSPVAGPQTFTFNGTDGESYTVRVLLENDMVVEGTTESFTVNLAPTSADPDVMLGTDTVTVDIAPSDRPVFELSVFDDANSSPTTVSEDDTNYTLRVEPKQGSEPGIGEMDEEDDVVTVTISSSGIANSYGKTPFDSEDFTGPTGVLSWTVDDMGQLICDATGMSYCTVPFSVVNDGIAETPEMFNITATSSDIGILDGSLTETIMDNDVLMVAPVDTSLAEAGGTQPVSVDTDKPYDGDFTVSFSSTLDTAEADDFALVPTDTDPDVFTLDFSGTTTTDDPIDDFVGDEMLDVMVDVADDAMDPFVEGDELFSVDLAVVDAGGLMIMVDSGDVTITDDDSATLTWGSDVTVDEDGGPAMIELTLSGASVETPFTVSFDSAGITAVDGDDYGAIGTAMFDGDTGAAETKMVSVAIIDDSLLEGAADETFTVFADSLGDAAGFDIGLPGLSTVSITDDDTASIEISGTDGAEGGADVKFTVSLSGGQTSTTDTIVSITLSGDATPVDDYTPSSSPIILATIPAGDNSVEVSLPVVDDDDIEGDESVVATVTQVLLGDSDISESDPSATAIIADNDDDTTTVGAIQVGNASWAIPQQVIHPIAPTETLPWVNINQVTVIYSGATPTLTLSNGDTPTLLSDDGTNAVFSISTLGIEDDLTFDVSGTMATVDVVPGDVVSGDGVGLIDFGVFTSAFLGQTPSIRADLDGDGTTGLIDFGLFTNAFLGLAPPSLNDDGLGRIEAEIETRGSLANSTNFPVRDGDNAGRSERRESTRERGDRVLVDVVFAELGD